MSDTHRSTGQRTPANTALVLDLVQWVAERPRPYEQVMDVWRTSCPRLTVWEDAVDAGFVGRRRDASRGALVEATPLGLRFLAEHGRAPSVESARAPN